MKPVRPPATGKGSYEAALARAKVFKLILKRSFFRKKIKLTSGKESDFYFDMKPTMFHPEGASLLAEMIFDRLKDEMVDCVGGMAVGAVPLISPLALVSYQRNRLLPGFFVRKDVKEHGTMKRIEGIDDLKDQNVVILDDVTTTGGSAMLAVEAARQAGANVILVLSIVDREEGAVERFKKEGVPFESLFKASEFLKAT
ncbi:MAG TPA: orotate phosphoribosyltransferase [Xanthobacteraceae bacterium]|nr:orotate phosphoribosyltransferase [Xanthobacteraceae bacterium]